MGPVDDQHRVIEANTGLIRTNIGSVEINIGPTGKFN